VNPSSESPRQAAGTVLQGLRGLAAGCLLALIGLGLAWELWLAPTGTRSWSLKVLPLALGLAGVLRYRMFTYRWLALLVWLYVAEGALRAATERGVSAALALAQALLGLLLFAACAAHVRWRLRRALP
jgi:uncharacterized membrane protein